MRKIFFAFLLTFILTGQANAYLLDEQVLETPNKKCKIYYLTEKNTHAWHIETDREECADDKLLRGYHNITVYNAFSKPVEKLYGYFSAGYWTGDSLLPEIDLKRFSDELGIQKATFPVYSDLDNNIFYIGQMTSKKTSTGAYPAFKVCAPFRMLGIIADTSRLNNPHFLQTIFQTVEKQTRRFCPAETEVQLYLSDTDNPSPQEVYMYVQLDLKSHHHKITRSPKASRQSLNVHQSMNDDLDEDELYQTLIPAIKKAKRKTALLRALSLDIDEALLSDALGDKNEEKLSETHFAHKNESDIEVPSANRQDLSDKTLPSIKNETNTETSSADVKDVSEEKQQLSSEFAADLKTSSHEKTNETYKEQSAEAYFDTTVPAISQETKSDQISIPTPQKSYLIPFQPKQRKKHIVQNGLLDISDEFQPAVHILFLLHLLNIPIKAQTVLHIQHNQAHILKDTVHIFTQKSNGWYYLRGIFSIQSKKTLTPVISLKPTELIACQKPFCADKEVK